MSSALTNGLLVGTIQMIKMNKANHSAAMRSAGLCIDSLYEEGDAVVDDLIELIADDDPEVSLLAMIMLGLLNEAGLNTTRAIGAVSACMSPASPYMVKVIAGASLGMLGYPPFVRVRDESMARMHVMHTRDWNGSMLSTLVDYFCGIPPK